MLRKIWNYLFNVCNHKWKHIEQIDIYEAGKPKVLPFETRYVLQCTKCGEIKSKRV